MRLRVAEAGAGTVPATRAVRSCMPAGAWWPSLAYPWRAGRQRCRENIVKRRSHSGSVCLAVHRAVSLLGAGGWGWMGMSRVT